MNNSPVHLNTALALDYAIRIAQHVNADMELTNAGFTAHAHATSDSMVRLFVNQGLCNDEAIDVLTMSFRARIADLFTKGVAGAGKLHGITADASHMLIDLDPRHAQCVVIAINAIAGSIYADEKPDAVNKHVDSSPDPDAVAGTIGYQRQLVARMNA